MVLPVVAAAAARAAATSAARAAATNAARTSAQATLRTSTQAAARTTTSGARAATTQGAGAQSNTIRSAENNIQTAPVRSESLQRNQRPPETRSSGERGAQEVANQRASLQSQSEEVSRTRDKVLQRNSVENEEVEDGQEEQEEGKRGMSFSTLMGMLIVAFVFDAIQTAAALLVFGLVTAIISYAVALVTNILAWVIFIIWFKLCGLNIFGGRKIVVAILGFVADTALAGIVPYWIVTVLVAYFDEKLEERGIGVSKVVSMLK